MFPFNAGQCKQRLLTVFSSCSRTVDYSVSSKQERTPCRRKDQSCQPINPLLISFGFCPVASGLKTPSCLTITQLFFFTDSGSLLFQETPNSVFLVMEVSIETHMFRFNVLLPLKCWKHIFHLSICICSCFLWNNLVGFFYLRPVYMLTLASLSFHYSTLSCLQDKNSGVHLQLLPESSALCTVKTLRFINRGHSVCTGDSSS